MNDCSKGGESYVDEPQGVVVHRVPPGLLHEALSFACSSPQSGKVEV